VTSVLPPPGRWALGNLPREDAEALLQSARDSGLTTAWLGQEAGFLSNLSLRENLELFHDWQGRTEPFADALATALALLGNDDSTWLEARVSQQLSPVLQSARLLRLLMLAPAVAVIEPADAARLLALPAAAFDTVLARSRLLLRGPACAEWPLPPAGAMLTDDPQESSTP
jgi:hypothetical protein